MSLCATINYLFAKPFFFFFSGDGAPESGSEAGDDGSGDEYDREDSFLAGSPAGGGDGRKTGGKAHRRSRSHTGHTRGGMRPAAPSFTLADLLAALDDGRLRAAALDVFEREPLPPGHSFWADPRIRVTPHIAGASLMDRTVRQIAGKIRALDRGEAISGIVDRDRQY